MKLFIKYNTGAPAEEVVRAELKKLGLHHKKAAFGETEIEENISPAQRDALGKALKKSGIELMGDKKSFLLEKIKNTIAELGRHPEKHAGVNISECLSKKLKHDYTYLSNMFSASKGMTIEHYYIAHKTGRVKELLLESELSISSIALSMGYSSVSHLSNQFRKTTGMTPSYFRATNKLG